MYCRQAANNSGSVFHELAPCDSPESLGNVSSAWATRFVSGTRLQRPEIGDCPILCSDSSDTAGSELHSQLRHSAMDADSPRDVFWHSRPVKAVIATLFFGECHDVSSHRGGR
jgi:hypothetical protein